MAKLNRHGLKMVGLRSASGNTINWSPRSGGYTEVFYDMDSGDVWTVDQVSLGHNSWTEYRSRDILRVCDTERHMTMQEIADMIHKVVEEWMRFDDYYTYSLR